MAAAKGNNYASLRKKNPTYSKKEINQIIKDLLHWAHTDNGIYIASYVYEKYKKPKSFLYDLSEHHPELKEALEQTRQLIAGKITNHCFIGDRNSTFGEKILPMYCKDYKAMLEWKASLNKPSVDNVVETLAQIKQLVEAGKFVDSLTQKEEKK